MAGGYSYRPTNNDLWPYLVRGLKRSIDARRQASTNTGISIDPNSGDIVVTTVTGTGVNIRSFDGSLSSGGLAVSDFSGNVTPASLVVQGF